VANGSSDRSAAIGSGAFVGIVGPSGAGKDSVIALARYLLRDDPSIVFGQRVVTRLPDMTEDNLVMSPGEMERIAAEGGFAFAWSAHDLSYAVPVALDDEVARGRVVVVNISRAVAAIVRQRYATGRIVLIDAPAAVRRARLANRGREDPRAVDARLAREVQSFLASDADLVIDNIGALGHSAQALADYITYLAAATRRAEGA
jgi:ribose 1,5-bisphosphokinase